MSPSSPPPEGRVYRPGATIVPLFFWAVMTGVTSGFLLEVVIHPPSGFEAKGLACLMAAFGILFGPVAFFVHLIRMCVVWVCLDPVKGLRLSGGRTIPWEEIRTVELKEAAFKGTIRPSPLMFLVSVGCWAVIYFVVLPSFALFTPWHRRVIVTLGSGEQVVLRDLGSAQAFTEDVAKAIEFRSAPPGASENPKAPPDAR